jgi:tRNA(His) 5'-end guanylyltransferase
MHQESNEKQIGQVFKDLEEQALTAKVLDPSNYFVARIDGKNFSTFTRPFKTMAKQTMGQNGYYCPLITEIMVLTTKDLVKKFGAVTGYTQSDEISLLFAPAKTEEKMANAKPGRIFDHPHSGRIVKLCTLMASYASARFNCHANYFA